MLSSNGTRLLRLWRMVLREGGSQKAARTLEGIANALPILEKSAGKVVQS